METKKTNARADKNTKIQEVEADNVSSNKTNKYTKEEIPFADGEGTKLDDELGEPEDK